MSIEYGGRVAIITGAGAGLGRSHALSLAARGAKVVINDPGQSKTPGSTAMAADLVADEIRKAGGVAVANYEAVGEFEAAQTLVKQAIEEFGRVDILINNAGILKDKSFIKMTEDDWTQVLKVHLSGTAFCTKAAWAVMKEQNYGRIVFTTSNAGLFGNFGQANYASAKMGMIGLMNVLKQEGQKYNILVNTVAPVAATNMTEGLFDPATLDYFAAGHSTAAVALLCSEAFSQSGVICSAFAGHFSLIEVCSTGGIQFDPLTPPSPDELLARWSELSDRTEMRNFRNSTEEIAVALEKAQFFS